MAPPPRSFRHAFMPIWRLQTTLCTAAILAVWVSLFLLDMGGFRQAVAEVAA